MRLSAAGGSLLLSRAPVGSLSPVHHQRGAAAPPAQASRGARGDVAVIDVDDEASDGALLQHRSPLGQRSESDGNLAAGVALPKAQPLRRLRGDDCGDDSQMQQPSSTPPPRRTFLRPPSTSPVPQTRT